MFTPSPLVNLLVIRSPDIHRAKLFYATIGLHFDLHAHGNGPAHYTSSEKGFVFEIYPLSESHIPTTSVRLGFNVTSVDEIVTALRKLGAVIVSDPCETKWGRRAVVRDFDGHIVELLTSSAPMALDESAARNRVSGPWNMPVAVEAIQNCFNCNHGEHILCSGAKRSWKSYQPQRVVSK
ncbi:MAG: VOC family protein [Cyanobacteria bacterium P01_D01_bin.44]